MIISVALQSVCAGGGHARITVSVGGQNRVLDITPDDLRAAAVDDAEFITILMRRKFEGMTRAQVRNALQTGFDMDVTL